MSKINLTSGTFKVVKEKTPVGFLENLLTEQKTLEIVDKVIQEMSLLKESMLFGALETYLKRRAQIDDYKKCTLVKYMPIQEAWLEVEELFYDNISLGRIISNYEFKNAGVQWVWTKKDDES